MIDAARTPPSHRWLLALTAALAAGLAVRLLFLGSKALWLDEAFSVWFSSQSWAHLWREVPQYETHPPLYYSLLKVWRSLGSDEFALRLPSALASSATAGLVALAAGIAAPQNHRLPLAATAAFLCAASPLQLRLAQEARPYALLMLGLGLALACATWIVANPERAGRPFWRSSPGDRCTPAAVLGLAIGAAVALWMHNLGIIFVAALGAILAAWWSVQTGRRAPLFMNLLAAALLAFLLYAPNLPTLLQQGQAVYENFWLTAPSPAALSQLLFQVYGQWQQSFEQPVLQVGVQLLFAAPLALLGIKGTWRLCADSPARRWIAWLMLGTALGPLLLMLALTYTMQPVLLARTLAPVQLPWAVLCAAAPFALGRQHRPLVWGMIAVLGLLNMGGFVASQWTPAQRDEQRPWRSIAAGIAGSDAAAAPVILIPNSSALPLGYYDAALGSHLTIHPLPARYPVRGASRYPAGGRGAPAIDAAVLPALQNLAAEAPTVWLVTRAERLFDPVLTVRRALAARFPCAASTRFDLITVTRFDRSLDPAKPGACP